MIGGKKKMARFPVSEVEKIALSQLIVQGLKDNPKIFPHPPIPCSDLERRIGDYVTAKNASIKARATSEKATSAKEQALNQLVSAMKKDIRYAENTVDHNLDKRDHGNGNHRDQ